VTKAAKQVFDYLSDTGYMPKAAPWGLLIFMYWNMHGTITDLHVKVDALQKKNTEMEVALVKVQSDLEKYTTDVNYVTNMLKDAGKVKIIKGG
jgi:hypothetical protein